LALPYLFFIEKKKKNGGVKNEMELNERINALEGEVKLIKTEIKKVLIDLREFMNNYENPFVNAEQLRSVPAPDNVGIKEEVEMTELREVRMPVEVVEPKYEPRVEHEKNQPASSSSEALKAIERVKEKVNGAEKMDIFMLTQLMKWADNSLATIGEEKLNGIIDLYDRTGRLTKEMKEVIIKIEDLSDVNHANEIEEIEMKEAILVIYQLDRIVTGETGTQPPLLLSEEELAKWLNM
jgi:hypothetical protein